SAEFGGQALGAGSPQPAPRNTRSRDIFERERMTGLFGSAILEVALGLFLLYLLLSIICSSVHEMVPPLLKLRSRDLVRGIANLVCDPAMFTAVMKHPTIVAFGNTDAEHSLVQR